VHSRQLNGRNLQETHRVLSKNIRGSKASCAGIYKITFTRIALKTNISTKFYQLKYWAKAFLILIAA